jgi:hypothetical protein
MEGSKKHLLGLLLTTLAELVHADWQRPDKQTQPLQGKRLWSLNMEGT